jgi:hypothetical protein
MNKENHHKKKIITESDEKIQEHQDKKPVLKGLCINCEHRFTCTLPRPETGVWYCEEYE